MLDLIPLWLDEVTVSFTCEDCRQKHRSVAPSRNRKIAPIEEPEVMLDSVDPIEILAIDKQDDIEISLEALQEEEANRDDDSIQDEEEL